MIGFNFMLLLLLIRIEYVSVLVSHNTDMKYTYWSSVFSNTKIFIYQKIYHNMIKYIPDFHLIFAFVDLF